MISFSLLEAPVDCLTAPCWSLVLVILVSLAHIHCLSVFWWINGSLVGPCASTASWSNQKCVVEDALTEVVSQEALPRVTRNKVWKDCRETPRSASKAASASACIRCWVRQLKRAPNLVRCCSVGSHTPRPMTSPCQLPCA